jgi:hypothetical protein
MKKIIATLCLLVLAATLAACGSSGDSATTAAPVATRPYENLTATDIASATVELIPPPVTVELDAEAIEKLVALLQTVEIYGKFTSNEAYAGQAVIYTLTKTDGSVETFMHYGVYAVVNGVKYHAEYEPSEALNLLGNTLAGTRFGQ